MSQIGPSMLRGTSVSTLLEPVERPRMDAAGMGLYDTRHRNSVAELSKDLRQRRVAAVVLSVARGVRESPGQLASLVREFPRIPTVALLSGAGSSSAEAVLSLGNCGVRRIVDVREPAGWHQLRALLSRDATREADRAVLAQLRADLGGLPCDCWRFFEAMFTAERTTGTVRDLAFQLGVLPSTLMSRFFRAELPAPKRYLAFARLIRAARLLENPGISLADTANQLDYSSPQSFGRHVQTLLGLTAGAFRHQYSEARMVSRFREELVLPHVRTLRALPPIGSGAALSRALRIRSRRQRAATIQSS
jgi:AraC-like DNA-binding protein